MRAGLDSQQQRLRFSDLGHLIGRRETFERGHEDSLGFAGPASRMVEFGEAKRRQKNWAAPPLLLGDRDSGPKGFLGAIESSGIVFLQDLAPKAVQEGQ